MSVPAFQDVYPDDLSHCYGCGSNNPQGHQLKSYWLEEEGSKQAQTIARFTPKDCHTAIPGFVYGGLIASLIDCHGTGSACAMAYKQAGRAFGSSPSMRFVTGKLDVNFLAPTPLGPELTLLGTFSEVKERKICIDIVVMCGDVKCASGHVIAVKMPENMGQQK